LAGRAFGRKAGKESVTRNLDPQIERRPIGALRPYEHNARKHPPEQVAQIAASIREWGWTMPVLIDEQDLIIAGHGRVEAAKLIGIDTVPVIVARGWTEAQRRAYAIADNRLTENSEWDKDLLALELGELQQLGFTLTLTGFDDDDLQDLLAEAAADIADATSLRERFGAPPFTILNARDGWWQARKAAWIALGIQSELGRGAVPSGSLMPVVNPATGRIARSDSRAGVIPGTDAKRSAAQNKNARTFGQDLMRGEHRVSEGKAKKRRPNAIPGGGGYGANSAYLFKTPNGYRSPKEWALRSIRPSGSVARLTKATSAAAWRRCTLGRRSSTRCYANLSIGGFVRPPAWCLTRSRAARCAASSRASWAGAIAASIYRRGKLKPTRYRHGQSVPSRCPSGSMPIAAPYSQYATRSLT
jgi:ParB-like nuclease domain